MQIKKKAAPAKKTLNLMVLESSASRFRHTLPFIIIGAVVLVLFAKFAVIDRLVAADRMETQAAAAEARLAELEEELTDYDAVAMEYSRYFSEGLGVGKDVIPLDCMEALKIVETYVMSVLDVTSVDFAENTATVMITGNALEQAADLMARLGALPQVADVTLFTANTGNTNAVAVDPNGEQGPGANVVMRMTITFKEAAE